MNGTVDMSAVAEQLAALHHKETGHEAIAVVVPLAEGRSEVVREFLEEGPPFDPREIGIESHKVFLTDREVVFVFEAQAGMAALERILAEPEFWEIVPHWQRHLAGRPRIGTAVYEWPERHRSEAARG